MHTKRQSYLFKHRSRSRQLRQATASDTPEKSGSLQSTLARAPPLCAVNCNQNRSMYTCFFNASKQSRNKHCWIWRGCWLAEHYKLIFPLPSFQSLFFPRFGLTNNQRLWLLCVMSGASTRTQCAQVAILLHSISFKEKGVCNGKPDLFFFFLQTKGHCNCYDW